MTLWTFFFMRRPKIGSLLVSSHEAHHDEQGVTLLGLSMVGKTGESSVSATNDGSDEMYSCLRRIEVGEERVTSTMCLYYLVTVFEGRYEEFLMMTSL